MPKVSLTDRLVATARCQGQHLDYFDAKTPGLNLRVAPSGHRAWSLVYTSPASGKRARVALGTYPALPLVEARARAIETRALIEAGHDPRAARAPTAAGTVAELIATYVRLHAHGKQLRSAREIDRRLKRDVLPVIGAIELCRLHRRDIVRVLDRIVERQAPAMARRVSTDLHCMIRFAVARGMLDHDVMAGMRTERPAPRQRFLSDREIAALWPALEPVLGPEIGLALKVALVTAQRIGEVVGVNPAELDLPKRVWLIPAARSKNKCAHEVPLTELAADLIEKLLAYGPRVSVVKVAQLIRRRSAQLPVTGWTPHDLRRTACTGMAMLGVSPFNVGAVVNHRGMTHGIVTTDTYVHYTYMREKREALELWAAHLQGLVAGAGNVLPMRRA
jgi:integrase